MMRIACQLAYFALFVLLVSGCGGGATPVEPKLDLVPVTGIVTLDGKPVADADITLMFDGTPPAGFIASGGKSDSSGKFIVMTGSKPGTVPGRYKIIISRYVMPDGSPIKVDPEAGMDLNQLQMSGQLKQLLPERYSDPANTQLSAAIGSGDKNELKLELTSS